MPLSALLGLNLGLERFVCGTKSVACRTFSPTRRANLKFAGICFTSKEEKQMHVHFAAGEDERHEVKAAMLVCVRKEDGTLCELQGTPLQLHVEAAEGAHGKCLRALTPLERGAYLVDLDAANALHICMEEQELVTTWIRLQTYMGACCCAFAEQARVPLTPSLNTEVQALMRAHDVLWQLAYLDAEVQDEHGVCMDLMQGIDAFSPSVLECVMWRLRPLDLLYFAIVHKLSVDRGGAAGVREMWTRLVLFMFWAFGDETRGVLLHKAICKANTTDASWEAYRRGETPPASTANAQYWSTPSEHGLCLLRDVDANEELTIDYGEYALPMEERLGERKKHMSPEMVAILLAVAQWISPELEQKIKCT